MWTEPPRALARALRRLPLLAPLLLLLAMAPAAARQIDPAAQGLLLVDPAGDFSPADALARRIAFRSAAGLWGRSGYAERTLWLLIPPGEAAASPGPRLLRIPDGRVSGITAWSVDPGADGAPTALPLTRLPYRFPVFALAPATAPQGLLLRIPAGEPMNFQLDLDPDTAGQAWLRRDALIMGAIFGVMAIMLVFQSAMLPVMRRLDQALLLPALALMMIDRLLRDGYAGWLLGPTLPTHAAIVGVSAAILAVGVPFWVVYLDLPREDPGLLPAWKGLAALGLGLLPLAAFPGLVHPVLLAAYVLWALLGMTVGLRALRRGAVGWFLILGAVPTLIPMTLTLAHDLGLVYPDPFPGYAMPLGFMIALTVAVLAASHRIDQMRRDVLRANLALQAHRRDLERTVGERTADLAAALERAERANRAKSDFLARMSHELRTPLNAILGYAQILQRSGLNRVQEEGRAIVERAGRHLLRLVNDLLDIARIEADALVLHPEPLQLNPFLDDLIASFRVQARQQGLSLELSLGPELPQSILADEARLRQLLANLIGNALKYTASGTVRLSVACLGDGGRLTFAVQDTGPGIGEAEQARIFEPFAQAGDGARRGAGVGLGLAIVRRLAAAMGGAVSLHSRPGAGSTFSFAADFRVCAGGLDAARWLPTLPVGYQGPPRLVLAVDDLADNRRLLQDLLAGLGFAVATADSGPAALANLADTRPDLVLLDIYMPDMDGFATLAALRALPDCAGLPVVAVSASVADADRARVIGAGFAAFVPKPVDLGLLAETLGTALALDWCYADEPRPAPEPAPRDTSPIACEADLWAAWQGLGEFPSCNEASAFGWLLAARGDERGDAAMASAGRDLADAADAFDPGRLAAVLADFAGRLRPAAA